MSQLSRNHSGASMGHMNRPLLSLSLGHMNRPLLSRVLACFILALLVTAACSETASANAAGTAELNIVVVSPPDDLTVSLRFADGKTVEFSKYKRAWETNFIHKYMYYDMMKPEGGSLLDDATIVVKSGNKSFEFPLSEVGVHSDYTLNLKDENLSVRPKSLARSIILITMRVVLTLLIEGFVFFLFGYRNKASWIKFLIVNLVTQGFLNYVLSLDLGSFAVLAFIGLEILIFIAEMIAFPLILKEHKKGRAVLYALSANFASLILGGILLFLLPI